MEGIEAHAEDRNTATCTDDIIANFNNIYV